MGNLTIWSFSLFLATIVFAIASFISIVVLWRTPNNKILSPFYLYTVMITIAAVIFTVYLGYWGIIGLRTWA